MCRSIKIKQLQLESRIIIIRCPNFQRKMFQNTKHLSLHKGSFVSLLSWVQVLLFAFFFLTMYIALSSLRFYPWRTHRASEGNSPFHLCPQMSRQQCGTALPRSTSFPAGGRPLSWVRKQQCSSQRHDGYAATMISCEKRQK